MAAPRTSEQALPIVEQDAVRGEAEGRVRSLSLGGAAFGRAGFVILALALFVLALQLLAASASGLATILERLSVDGPLNLFGFGWLGAYVALSGSPVAATALSLFSGDAISDVESFTMINGSRFGASFMVLFVGFLYYLRHHRNPDGLYIGVVALLATFTVYTPSMLLGLLALEQGWFDGVSVGAPPGVARAIEDGFGALAERAADALPGLVLFALGVGVLLISFQLFDRALPNLDPPSPRLERVLRFFRRPLPMFAMGGLVTIVTLSVSVSLTLLVPLSLKGIVQRQSIIPYVMGANITTFVDTLLAAVLLDTPRAVTVVVTQMALTTVVSAVVLLLLYQPYQRIVLGLAHRVTARRRAFAAFLATIFLVPGVLLAV